LKCQLIFFEENGLNYFGYNVNELGYLFPFPEVFPTAVRIEPDCVQSI